MNNSFNKSLRSILIFTFLTGSQVLFSQECHQNETLAKHTESINKYKKHLENTTWIVPPSTLLAYEYLNGTSVPVNDQTVWVITKYDQGYFFGTSYTSINATPSSQKTLLGSITPYGDVLSPLFRPMAALATLIWSQVLEHLPSTMEVISLSCR